LPGSAGIFPAWLGYETHAGKMPALPESDAPEFYALPVSQATVTRRGRLTRLPPQFGQTEFMTIVHAEQNVHS